MIGYILLGIFAAFLLVIILRAACFRPKKQPPVSNESVSFDGDRVVDTLAELIRCKTVSYSDPSLEDDAEFEKLVELLPRLYP